MDVGAHCSKPDCRQQDFLPFTCDCCAHVFCLEHRSYAAHECPLAGTKDHRVLQCPLCKQMVRWTGEQDVNLVWEQHVSGGTCVADASKTTTRVDATGELRTQKKKKPRCAAAHCKEVLLTSNRFHCPKCQLDVCLRHRYEEDHDCEGMRRRQREQRVAAYSRTSTSKLTARSSLVKNTKSAMTKMVEKGKAAAQSVATSASAGSEECPICQQKFAYVSQLIAHVNRSHPETNTRQAHARTSTTTAAAAGQEVCPQCRAVFRDVTALINHVESAHAGAQVAANGNGDDKCVLM